MPCKALSCGLGRPWGHSPCGLPWVSRVVPPTDSESDDEDEPSKDELFDMLEDARTHFDIKRREIKDLRKELKTLKQAFDEINATHERLEEAHEKLLVVLNS